MTGDRRGGAPSRRRLARLAGVCVLAGLGLAAVMWKLGRRPDLVVVVDTLRADRLGSYGNRRGLTPFLDELAGRGARFANAYAAASWTSPSVASIFTSRYPTSHTVTSFDAPLPAEETPLAERLKATHYHQFGFVSNFRLSRELGFGRGFDAWFPYATVEKVRVRGLTAAAVAFLDEMFGQARGHWWRTSWRRWTRHPIHLYVHCMEPHVPYLPPEPYRATFARDAPPGLTAEAANDALIGFDWERLDAGAVAYLASLYDAEVAALDADLRGLFAALDSRGLLANAVVVVTADHGEEFLEHGRLGHGMTLYEEVLRVPFIVVAPGIAGGTVMEEPVSLIDLAPTVLDLLGLPPEPRFEGRSLAPRLHGGAAAPRDVIAELPPNGTLVDPAQHRAAIVREGRKLIAHRHGTLPSDGHELYDLGADPGEHAPLSPEPAGTDLSRLSSSLREAMARFAARASRAAPPAIVSPEIRDRLRALGYVAP